MQIITDFNKMSECAVCLGNFDGLHSAHMRIIEDCAEYAKKNNIPGGVLLFENHTATVLKNEKYKLITTLEEKLEILKGTQIDFVFLIPFDEEFMKKTPDEFFAFLTGKIKASALFAGFDYRFGYKAKGDAKMLAALGEKNGVYVRICDEINDEGGAISSTRIRKLISSGKIEKANSLLKRPFLVSGTVERGKQNGIKMGLPTANVSYAADKLLPADGVYYGFSIVDGKTYKSIINIGKNPTFDAGNRTIESHIIGYSNDIYEKHITVGFLEKIRDEIKFSSMDELKEQIKRDIKHIERKELCI